MASYTRQSSFADGDTITAALFNNEFNQLVNAFHNSTGHKHDGTTAEGPVIGLIGDAGETSPNNKVLIDTTNNFIEFYVEVSSAPVQQLYIADGAIVPVTDSDVDLGTTSLRFKDTYTDTITTTGNVDVGGNLTVTGTTTFNGGTITMGDAATDNVVFGADVDSNIIPDDDDTYDLGSSGQEWRNLYIDGTANIDSLVADTADINAGTIDGATIATSDITVGSGKTLDVSAGTLTLADNQISGDKVEGGTINATTINTLTYGSLSDGAITVTAFVDEDNMASDSATLLPTQQSVKAYVDSQVTAQDLDFLGDSGGALSIDLDSESLTVAGGTGIDTVGSGNTLTVNIDSTVATLTDSQTLTNKTIDVDNNTVSNIEVDNLKTGVLDTDLSSVAATDTTLASAKAIKTYVDSQVTAQDLDLTDGTTTIAIDLDSETLSVLGGTGVTSTASGNGVTLAIGQAVGTTDNVSFGTVTAALTGNASTATTLETARTIGGVSFDGSANINLAGVNTAGNQDTTGNAATATALETARTIGGTSFDGTANIAVGLADTATILATARTIGGVSFDGSANIDLPGVNTTGNQDTSGLAGTATALATARTINGVSFDGTANITTLTAGTGITVSGTEVSIPQTVATTSSPTFANMTLSGTGSIKVPSGTTAQRDGSPANGMFRYNTTDAQFEGYADGAWGAIAGGGAGSAIEPQIFAGDGSTVNFTLTSAPTSENNLWVFIDGAFQAHDSYSVSGTTLTFSTAPANTRVVTVYHARSNVSGANMIVDTMTGDNSDTTLTLSVAPVSANNVQVYFDGVYQNKANYSISGTTLTFSTAPATGVAVEAITHTQTTINEPANGTVTSAKLDTNIAVAGTLTVTGDANFDSNTLFVDSSANAVGIGTASPNQKLELMGADAYDSKLRFSYGAGAPTYFADWGYKSDGNKVFLTMTDGGVAKDVLVANYTGNVGIGNNNPSDFNSLGGKQVVIGDGTQTNNLTLYSATTGGSVGYGHLAFADSNTSSSTAQYAGLIQYYHGDDSMSFYTGSTSRMRITSAGHVLINTTTLQGAGGLSLQVGGNNVVIENNTTSSAGNGTEYQVFRRNSSQIGSITMNGTTAVQYNTSSDYRLKENVVTDWEATSRLKQLKPSRFNFITEPDRTVDGFLAHEVQDIVPEAIAGIKDEMQEEEYEVTPAVLDEDGNVVTEAVMGTREVPKYQGIDQSKLVPLLVKTIQELEERITTLENA